LLRQSGNKKTGKKFICCRCDGAGRFCGEFAKYLELQGIEMDVTTPYEHWMNGKIKCFMHTIKSQIRAVMTMAQLPEMYWGEAALTASYLLNVTITCTLPSGMTPFEAFHNHHPNIAHLWTWGTCCFAHVPQE
jgi:hypothetical protein